MTIIAQLKNQQFRKLLDRTDDIEKFKNSNQQLFIYPINEDIESINFLDNPSYKLDNNQFFYISYDDDNIDPQIKVKIQESIDNIYNITDQTATISNISKTELSSVLWICSYLVNEHEQTIMNLQHITKAKYVENTHFLSCINDHVIYQEESNRLEVYNRVDICINQADHKIYFKSFAHLKNIHSEFTELYKEASKEQQSLFIDKINNSEIFNIDLTIKIEPSNLKHIRFLIEQNFEIENPRLMEYINRYQNVVTLEKDNDKYQVKKNKDITVLIKVLNEAFYTGELTGKQRESNSSKIIAA